MAKMTTTSKHPARRRRETLDVPLTLDRSLGNQARQAHAGLRAAILDGRLATGARLPSSRALAEQLGVRRNAIVAAYEHLHSDGLVEARRGSGTFVAERVPTPAPTAAGRRAASDSASSDIVAPDGVAPDIVAPKIAAPAQGAFALGRTHVDDALKRRLAIAARRRIAGATEAEFGYGDPRGSAALRRELAAYLAANRGVRADPDCILIVGGVQQGIRLCAAALLAPGASVWMEDPGYVATRRTLGACSVRLVPVGVDESGLDVAAGRRVAERARAAYVTPSNQFPMGVAMSMARRAALLDWAREVGAWIFEDDYDSEFRHEGPPLTALAGLGGGDRVIYFGTLSKMLFAGLRIAYVVLPPAIVEQVVAARATFDRFPPRLMEGAVADLMADGRLAAHIRRMRARYRGARDALADALERAAGGALRIVARSQGLHLLAWLPDGAPADAARRIRSLAQVEAGLISETRLTPGAGEGFILGFAGHEPAALKAAAERLGRAARAVLETDALARTTG